MLERLLSGESFCDIPLQKTIDEILCLLRHIAPNLIIEVEFAILNVIHNLLLVPSTEWRLARQNNVHDDSSRPQVALLGVALLDDLGGNVVGSTDHLRDWEIFLLELLGGSKVN